MNRPLHTWLLFTGCLTVLLVGLGWVTWTALRLERGQAEAQQKADFEEKVRLALWRMDSTLAPLIVEESSRPYFTYSSFYAAERAYNRMFGELSKGEVLVPSPLLTQTSSNVLLHFQYGPDCRLTSPQVPEANHRQLAQSASISPEQLTLAKARLNELEVLIQPADLVRQCTIASSQPRAPTFANAGAQIRQDAQQDAQIPNGYYAPGQVQQQQVLRNNMEQQARAQTYVQAATWNTQKKSATSHNSIAEGMVKPIWLGDALVLARRVSVEGRDYIQGCWLDWPNIRKSLLQNVHDLLPSAELVPVRDGNNDPQARLLAAIPVKLNLPQVRFAPASILWTPVRLSLAFAWACVLVAAAAVGSLLYGTVALSERRAAFVSAVTHELRTPLTTFKMYSEMLAANMVPDEEKRRSYLDTLCAEANRLSHLVENVLAYARLERGSARSRVEKISIGELLDRVQDRLHQRAEQAGMKVLVDSDSSALQTAVHVDVSAVEQILFNLVDNACKYGMPLSPTKTRAPDSPGNGPPILPLPKGEGRGEGEQDPQTEVEHIIHLEAFQDHKSVMLRVRDHGQGISAAAARRLFRPFSKSADEAAHTAPGVGLGLALCRRLSRTMGGDLRFDSRVNDGACFVLQLPLSV